MVKVANPHLPTELPSYFLSKLDPKLADLYSQLPSVLASRVSNLVNQAPHHIDPNRVLKFACLYARAERSAQGDSDSKEHRRRAKLELAGKIHGLQSGYQDDTEARQRYRRGRRARQQLKSSLESVLRKWRVFEQTAQKHRSELPEHVQSRFSNAILREVGRALNNMGMATVLDEEEDLASEKGRGRERSEIAQTYIWWYLKMAPYRGKWNDMHQLAYAWCMSPVASIQGFRTVVYRICKGITATHQFETSWESVLSEKV
jgi:hypothetical protein